MAGWHYHDCGRGAAGKILLTLVKRNRDYCPAISYANSACHGSANRRSTCLSPAAKSMAQPGECMSPGNDLLLTRLIGSPVGGHEEPAEIPLVDRFLRNKIAVGLSHPQMPLRTACKHAP